MLNIPLGAILDRNTKHPIRNNAARNETAKLDNWVRQKRKHQNRWKHDASDAGQEVNLM